MSINIYPEPPSHDQMAAEAINICRAHSSTLRKVELKWYMWTHTTPCRPLPLYQRPLRRIWAFDNKSGPYYT